MLELLGAQVAPGCPVSLGICLRPQNCDCKSGSFGTYLIQSLAPSAECSPTGRKYRFVINRCLDTSYVLGDISAKHAGSITGHQSLGSDPTKLSAAVVLRYENVQNGWVVSM